MIEIQEKSKCCGCTACQSICPQKCIQMQSDEEGFLYPIVNQTLCVNCGLCERVCPILSGYQKSTILESWVVRHTNEDILKSSTSGGAFSAIGKYALEHGGVVYGCVYNSKMKIVHACTDDTGVDLSMFRGSKYIQSDVQGVYSQIEGNLKNGRLIVFSGTSCQIAGLNNYLKEDYDNLITVEVICHGTPSPFLWTQYLEYQERKYHSNPKSINFRKKTYGYHSGTMEIEFENGKRYTGSARVDLILKSFFCEIASRPSCYECPCKGMERSADFSIYDCWSAGKLIDDLNDDDRGYTNVMVNTEKGQKVIRYCQNRGLLWCQKVNTEKAIALDGIMVCNYPHKHPKREVFYKTVCAEGIEKAVQQYIPITYKDYLIENSKRYVYKLGCIRIAHKIKEWKNSK